ncbi:hypothetical protein Bca101_074541 [Brassica carinata]
MFPNDLDNKGLPLTERILEEEDWLDDENDFGDADGNDFGEEDIDLMEEDDLLGEELQDEGDKRSSIKISGILKPISATVETIGDETKSSEIASLDVDSKNGTPAKVTIAPASHDSVPSTKKKNGGRSPSTIGVSLRQHNLIAGIASPKAFAAGHGLCGTKAGQLGPSWSGDQKKARGPATQQTNNSKVPVRETHVDELLNAVVGRVGCSYCETGNRMEISHPPPLYVLCVISEAAEDFNRPITDWQEVSAIAEADS